MEGDMEGACTTNGVEMSNNKSLSEHAKIPSSLANISM